MFEQPGVFEAQATRVLWLARLSRPDIVCVVGRLENRVTVWTQAKDVHLNRLVYSLTHSIITCCAQQDFTVWLSYMCMLTPIWHLAYTPPAAHQARSSCLFLAMRVGRSRGKQASPCCHAGWKACNGHAAASGNACSAKPGALRRAILLLYDRC